MNRLRRALAVIERRLSVHDCFVVQRLGGLQAQCACGWEGPVRTGSGDGFLAALDVQGDVKSHCGTRCRVTGNAHARVPDTVDTKT